MDGGPFATVSVQDVAALGLKLGRALDAAVASAIERRAEAFAARAVALRMLGYRALPAREITRRLTRKGHARPVAEAVVSELEAAGLVNAAEFAVKLPLAIKFACVDAAPTTVRTPAKAKDLIKFFIIRLFVY